MTTHDATYDRWTGAGMFDEGVLGLLSQRPGAIRTRMVVDSDGGSRPAPVVAKKHADPKPKAKSPDTKSADTKTGAAAKQ